MSRVARVRNRASVGIPLRMSPEYLKRRRSVRPASDKRRMPPSVKHMSASPPAFVPPLRSSRTTNENVHPAAETGP